MRRCLLDVAIALVVGEEIVDVGVMEQMLEIGVRGGAIGPRRLLLACHVEVAAQLRELNAVAMFHRIQPPNRPPLSLSPRCMSGEATTHS